MILPKQSLNKETNIYYEALVFEDNPQPERYYSNTGTEFAQE